MENSAGMTGGKEIATITGANVMEPQQINICPKGQEHMGFTYIQPFEILPQNEAGTDANILPHGDFWSPTADMQSGAHGNEIVPSHQVSMEMSLESNDGLGQFLPSYNPNVQR